MSIIKILLVLVLILRINLFVLPSFKVDMNSWKAWSYKLAQVGPSNFYSPNYFSDYFPGYLYILWISGSLFNLFSMPITGLLFEFFLKFVTSLFDIGSAFYIYKIASRYSKKWAYFAPILYLANPAVIFNSSVWGQIDGIFTFFLLMSAQFLFEKKEIYKSLVSLSLGILVKPQSLAFMPILFTHLWNNFPKNFLKSSLFGLLVILILSFPFFPKNPIFGLVDLGSKSQDVYQYTSLFAFNFWGIFGAWKPDNLGFILSLKTWGIVLYLCSIVLISLPLLKRSLRSEDLRKKVKTGQLYFAISLSLFSFFLFLTRMHERYLFPFLAFFLIAAIIQKSKTFLTFYFLTSILHFINLWFVYYYYNFVYENSSSAYNFVYTSSLSANIVLKNLYPLYLFINDNFRLLSLLMVILYCSLFFYYFKTYVKKSKA